MPATSAQFIHDLRHTEIVQSVGSDPRTEGDLLLGVDRATAMEAINWGQADFDQPIGTLSAADRVLLYAYWNQRGHVAELSEAFRQMFAVSRPRDPFIVVDLGCGPFTGGLAFAGQLGAQEKFDYIGVDRSGEMRRFGEKLAAALDGKPEAPRISRQWGPDIPSVHWTPPRGWPPVLVIVSFLLASPTLDVRALLAELDGLLRVVGRGEVTVLYTNSAKAGPNRNLPVFREVLLDAGLREVVNEVGTIKTERATRSLHYALFHRPSSASFRSEATDVRLPTWDELSSDEEQLEVLEAPLDEPLFVVGPQAPARLPWRCGAGTRWPSSMARPGL